MWLSRAGGDKGAFNQMLNRLETKVDRERRETLISALFFTRPQRAVRGNGAHSHDDQSGKGQL